MTFQIGLMLASLAVAVVLFSLEWFTADTIALGLLMTLVLTGLLPVERAFEGFGSDTVFGNAQRASFSALAILLVPRFWPLR